MMSRQGPLKKVFIDGSAGTTGLRIGSRLAGRNDVALCTLPDSLRKDEAARRDALNSADVAILCLPDDAAREAADMVSNPDVVVIDTSTAHRVSDGWEYGFPELSGRRERIAKSKRIANPGCHASGFVALVEPLVRAGLVSSGAALSAFSLTGYSGGGKKMIADYEDALGDGDPVRRLEYSGGRVYALSQSHKHIPEIVKICGLSKIPLFSPIVVPHETGMETVVSFFAEDLAGTPDDIRRIYAETYGNGNGAVFYDESMGASGMISSSAFSGRDSMSVGVCGGNGRIMLVALFDNLGKGASGAAIQNMNIALGFDELSGLKT